MFCSKRPILGITGRLTDVSVTPGLQFGYLRIRFSDKWQEKAINGIDIRKTDYLLKTGVGTLRICRL